MKHLKLLISDLDFTLLNSHRELSEVTKQKLQTILDKGVEVVPCSARPLSQIPEWFLTNPDIHYLVCSNGAVIVDNPTKKPLKKATLSNRTVLDILHAAAEDPYWTVAVNGEFHSHDLILRDYDQIGRDEDFAEKIRKTRVMEPDESFIFQCEEGSIEKVHFITSGLKDEQRERMICKLSSIKNIMISSSHRSNIEITHPDAGKGQAVNWLIERLQLDREQVAAAGDNENDLPMLKEAGIRIAVANATPQVLAIANRVAASCDEDGVVHCLCEILKEEQK